MDGAQRMSNGLADNCVSGVMRVLAHCRGGTSKSGFPTIHTSSHGQHPSNVLKLPSTTVCLPSDNGQCLSNQKTQPESP